MRVSQLSFLLRSSVTFPPYDPGSSAAMIVLPSVPSHVPTLNGIPLAEPHVSFCVEKPRMPQCASMFGSAAVKPKQSGSMNSALSIPNSRRKNWLPYKTCRMCDSAEGTLLSFSSTLEPHENQRPCATHCFSFSYSSG